MTSPYVTSPRFNDIVEKCPEGEGADSNSEAAEEQHEQERRQDMNPEVKDHHHREYVDGSLTPVAIHLCHPGGACNEPAHLEEKVNCECIYQIFLIYFINNISEISLDTR